MRDNFRHRFLHLVLFIFSLILPSSKIIAGSTPLGVKCIDNERRALLDFKSYIVQDPYNFLSTWMTDEEEATNDCCNWRRVTCDDQTGHVTSLELIGGELEGMISPSLLNLSYLNYLDLSFNSFSGSVPMFIGSMTRLRYLDLSYNSFTGPIPPALGNLTNLQEFLLNSIGNCTIENIDWLSHMSHLHHLELDGISLGKANHWVDVILRLQKLSHLSFRGCDLSQVMNPYSSSIRFLNLGNNNLNSSMYHWLFPLTSNKLEYLDLSYNKLDGIPKYVGNLCSLETLNIDSNHIAFKFRDFLYNLTGCTSATLKELDASSNQFTGSLSDDIQKFSSLYYFDLSYNLLNGTISEKVWQLPRLQYLYVYSNSLKGAISEYIGKSKLRYLDLSNNPLEGVHFETHMLNLSYIESIRLRSCKLGPHFPKWIQKLKNLTDLDISNNGISDTILVEFWNMWPSQLTYLDLSSNNVTGKVTDLLSNFDNDFLRINLSSNNFHGFIEHVHSRMVWLDLSKNKFHGEISFLCQIVDGYLVVLDLSQNSFTGKIPDCLWNFKYLKILNLGQNNLYGRLPTSIGYLTGLEVLYLNNNNFSGELPSSLKNCTKLTFLELKSNNFSGYVTVWIGEKLLELYVLSLTSNNFFGTIPLQLCHLVKLQILDLSMNNLYGTIPSCLNNLTTMVHGGFSPDPNVHRFYIDHGDWNEYVDHEMIKWQGTVREFRSTLGLVKSIDLSSNNLSGYIPYELTDLHELITLNLSMNALDGEIPSKIGLLRSLLHLDLSRNNLSGRLPTSMSQMTSLDYLDVSCNNLSGRIPSSTQLQSFDPSSYTENEGLCGLPLTKSCPGDKETEVPTVIGQSEGSSGGIDELERWFYIGGATGFATGFWIICGTLLGNRHARYVFFHIIDSFKDWVYVKVMVFVVNVNMHRQ